MITWTITVERPLEVETIIAMLAAHAIPGVEEVDREASTCRRLLLTDSPDLDRRLVDTELGFSPDGVEIRCATEDATVQAGIGGLVRRWFDFDADLVAVHEVLRSDPTLEPLIAERPGLRVIEYPHAFEAAAITVLGQQVSVAAARTFAGRLVAHLGSTHPSGLRQFPSPDRIAETDPDDLRAAIGLTRSRTATLLLVAEEFVRLDPVGPLRRDQIMAIRGMGPWSADYLDVRSAGDRDGFTPGDLVLRRALGVTDVREAAKRAEPWRPFRAYALFHLWVNAVYS